VKFRSTTIYGLLLGKCTPFAWDDARFEVKK
jgi:hypothetical protein